jgi:hypothetical protein
MRNAAIVILAVGILLAFAACDETVIDDYYEWPPPSPAAIVESIEVSFNTRDIDDLKGCLASDFIFYFDPEDVGGGADGYIIPESWRREEFLSAAETMFDVTYGVDISIDASEVDDPIINDKKYTAAGVPVRFLIMVDAVSGFFAQGTFTFEFGGEYNAKHGNEWFVIAWRDFTAPDSKRYRNVKNMSFGEILVRFRKP